MNKNSFKYIISEIFYICTGLLTTGTVFQTFLLELGLDEQTIASFDAIMLVIQSASMFLFANYIENKRDIRGLYANTSVSSNIMLLPMLALCFISTAKLKLAFGIICIFTLISRILGGIKMVSMYKFPYHIINMRSYGRLVAISGMSSGIFAALFSLLIMTLNKQYGFFSSMKYIIFFGILVTVLSYFVIISARVINKPKVNSEKLKYSEILKYKPFYKLLLPNLLRGIYLGIFNVAVIIGYHNGAIDSTGALSLTLVIQLAQVLGAFLYSRVCRSDRDGQLILIFALLTITTLGFIVTSSTYVFFITFFIAKVITTIIDNAVPVAVTKIVDYKHIGRYSALRLLTNTLGTAIGSAVIIPMLDIFGNVITLVFTSACILIFALSYHIFFKSNNIPERKEI